LLNSNIQLYENVHTVLFVTQSELHKISIATILYEKHPIKCCTVRYVFIDSKILFFVYFVAYFVVYIPVLFRYYFMGNFNKLSVILSWFMCLIYIVFFYITLNLSINILNTV
jgi:hypothetical protein